MSFPFRTTILYDILVIMKQFYFVIFNDKSFVHDTCYCAKQKKLPFPSDSYASHPSHPLDLIHVDVWGPCASSSINGHRYFLSIVYYHTRHV